MWEEIRKIKEGMAHLGKLISDLYIKVNDLLNKPVCDCECKAQPNYREIYTQYFYTDENGNITTATVEELNLNDVLPFPACPDEKGLVFLNDAVIFCSYHNQDGWVIRCALNRP